MTTNASHAAGARCLSTKHTVTVQLTPDDLTMIRAFLAWNQDSPRCSPKKKHIERGYGAHDFPRFDSTGPNTFKRLVFLGVIEHSRNGHCWLTAEGLRVAKKI